MAKNNQPNDNGYKLRHNTWHDGEQYFNRLVVRTKHS